MGYFRFNKRRDLFISYDNPVLLEVILQCGFPSCTLQFGQEKNIPGHPIESRAYWFILKIARMLFILASRNNMMNTFITVNITPHVRDSLWDKSLLFYSNKAFLLPSVWLGTEYTWALIGNKSLLICFESYLGIPYFSYWQNKQEFEHFANG